MNDDSSVSDNKRTDTQPYVDGLIARLAAATEGSVQMDCLIADATNRPPFPYTTSLYAALSLVPDRHRWLLDKRPGAYFRSDGYRAEVYREAHPYNSDRSDVPMHWVPTPALALCIAALKARAAQ